MWLPSVELSSASTTFFGSYPDSANAFSFSELYASPRASSLSISALLLPSGGLSSTTGMGGVGTYPMKWFSQPARAATSHSMLVQTPHVYTSLSSLAVVVQCYDAHGNSHVSQAALTVTASLSGASLSLQFSGSRGPGGLTRRYSVTLPESWFSNAGESGSMATVTTTLAGRDSHQASFTVYGTPSSFSSRLSAAGMTSFFTSDVAGTTAAQTMRAGEFFYLQLYAHTGGLGLTSFEIKIVEDPAVCELVPVSGPFTSTYTGAVQGVLSSTYRTEALTRLQEPGTAQYFTKYSGFGRLEELQSNHGHLGYIRLKMVGTGACLTSAQITTFYHSGGTAFIPGVSMDQPVARNGNTLARYEDAYVGVFGELAGNAPIVNTADFTGGPVSVSVRSLLFKSPDSLEPTFGLPVQTVRGQGSGVVSAAVSAERSGERYEHKFNITVVHPGSPTLEVDDALLQALPGTCGTFQRTRLRAIAGGVDISRLLTFESTNTGVLTIDSSNAGRVIVVGVGVGTAEVYVREVSYAMVSVTVSATVVGLTRLKSGIVTGVQWASAPALGSTITAFASHEFTSEDSVGWIYTIATYEDGTLAITSP